VTEFIEKEFPLHRLGDVLNRLFNNSDPEVEGGHDHTSLYAPPTWSFGLRFVHSPPRMSLPARLPCPSRFAPTVASHCNAMSRTSGQLEIFMTRILLMLALALGLTCGSASDLLAKGGSRGGSKGGHYSGEKGSSHKGGQYAPPYGRQYKK